VARANQGSGHLNNLYAACVSCNRGKQDGLTRTARAAYGRTRAPVSRDKVKEKRGENALVGGTLGALGFLVNPVLGILTTVAGAVIGHGVDPE
jgi:hypothetical protein